MPPQATPTSTSQSGLPAPGGRWASAPWASLVLAALVFAVYAKVGGHGFTVMDDIDYVTGNAEVRSGLTWEGVRWAFAAHESNWHPLTWLSHMADCEFFGLTPGAHHLVNVVLHAANAVLLFLAMRMMTGTFWRSLGVAVIFALHPQRVESVAWISERKDVLSGFFWMLALVSYAWYARRPGWVRYACLFAAMALGLMSKSMLVTLPFVLLLLDFWPLGRSNWKKLVMEKLPLFALAVAASAMAFASQSGGAVTNFAHMGLGLRVGNALESWVAYLWQMAWPFGLSPFYPHPMVGGAGVSRAFYLSAIGAAVILLAVTWGVLWAAFWAKKKRAWLAVGWFWYVGTLVPVIGIIQIGVQSRADRYTYLPMIGIGIMLAWGAGVMVARWPEAKKLVWGGAAAALGGWMALTWVQVSYWRDDFKLFGRAIQVTEGNYFAHNEIGMAYQQRGDFVRAVENFSEAVRIHPASAHAHTNLCLGYLELGKIDKARAHLERALKLNIPRESGLRNLVLILGREERFADAVTALEELLEISPADAWANSVLALMNLRLGREAEASVAYERAIELDPGDALTLNNLANASFMQKRFEDAVKLFEKVVGMRPEDVRAHLGLGLVYAQLGRLDDAQEVYTRALAIVPENTEVLNSLAVLHLRAGRTAEGQKCIEQVLRIDPENEVARRNLAKLRETSR